MHFARALRILLFALVLIAVPALSIAQIGITVSFGPPPLPVYAQPPCPDDGYIWTPGYWAWDPDEGDYYWVPGTWVLAPQTGYLWTPGWWGWGGSGFLFHEGYWGPVVGFYGGIAYGFGYPGTGYQGGRWDGDRFYYNRSVTNVNVTNVHNVYNTTVINNNTVNRVSYNGGEGGVTARPTAQEQAAENQRHMAPVAAQTQQVQAARGNRELRASVNQGKPAIAATPKPGAFSDRETVAAKEAGGPYHPPANRAATPETRPTDGGGRPEGNTVPRPPVHPNDLPPFGKPTPPNTGDTNLDKKYAQQQQKLQAQQEKDRQKLQQQQDKEHQQMLKQQANAQKQQDMEQRHQQQTQAMQQRHADQQQQMQTRQQPPHPSQPPPEQPKK
jgi:hypothetical protein